MKKIITIIFLLFFVQSLFAIKGDINKDGVVDGYDLIILARSFGSRPGHKNYNALADLSRTGMVDGEDLSILASNFGKRSDSSLGKLTGDFVPGQIVVRFLNDVQSLRKQELIDSWATRIISDYDELGVSLIAVPEDKSEEKMIEYVSSFSEIEYAELNYIYKSQWTPDDTLYPYQWHFKNMNVDKAWDISRGGSSEITVAVIDSGVAYEDYGQYRLAPDLKGTTFVSPYNFINNTTHANDQDGHGTHVTGTIAQTTNNAYGTAGIAFNCKIMPLKVLDASGSGTTINIARAITHARENGANVINMSLGGGGYSATLSSAIQNAYNSGIVLVAATGNDADSPGYTPNILYPAKYNNVIAVGAVRYDNSRSYYSNYGEGIDFVAPGGDVRVDQNRDGYPDGILQQTFINNPQSFSFYFFQGTSMAAPHVSGVVALLMSVGVREPQAVYNLLMRTAIDLGPEGYDTEYGHGMVDAFEAVNQAIAGMGWAN